MDGLDAGRSSRDGVRISGTVASRLRAITRTVMALGLVSALAVVLAVVQQRSAERTLVRELVPAQSSSRDLVEVVEASAGAEPGSRIGPDGGERPPDEIIVELREDIRRSVGSDPGLRDEFADIESLLDRWRSLVGPGGGDGAGAADPAALLGRLLAFRDHLDQRVDQVSDELEMATAVALVAAIGTGALLVSGGAAGLFLVRRWITDPVDRLTDQVEAVVAGDLDHAITVSGPDDLAAIGAAVEAMRRRLRDDGADRAQAALIAGHLAESERLAGDLHDDQIQAMTLASIRLQQLRRRVDGEPETRAAVETALEVTNAAIGRLRRMIFELRSPVLEWEGLREAVQVYLEETFGAEVAWSVSGDPGRLDDVTAALAYRLTRDAMFNAFKHADPGHVSVMFERDAERVGVEVTDDGRGFEPTALHGRPGHMGMGHARQLALAAGGTWSCRSRPGEGTTVRFELPPVLRPPRGGTLASGPTDHPGGEPSPIDVHDLAERPTRTG